MKPLLRLGLSAGAAILALTHFTGCLGSEPKVLGNKTLNFDAVDTTNDENFKFSFAYLDTSLGAPHDKTVTLQGAANSRNAIISACNSAGTGCVCEFFNAAGVKIEESASGFIQFDTTGNYVRCSYPGATAPRKVRLRNIAETKVSAIMSIKNQPGGTDPITIQELFADKDLNDLRTVYIYDCLFNFLQKKNTTAVSFDCTDQSADPCGGASGLCILQAPYPFYLYADNLTNNFNMKIADLLYNSGGSDRICNTQIKRIDCTAGSGTPKPHFGLYGEQTGIYQQAVALSAGPGVANQTYGFAADLDSYLGTDICPPGLVPYKVFEAEPDETSMEVGAADGVNDNNIPDGFKAYSLDNASGPSLLSLIFTQFTGGNCDGTTCSVPTTNNGPIGTFNYNPSGTSTFCVIPKELLP